MGDMNGGEEAIVRTVGPGVTPGDARETSSGRRRFLRLSVALLAGTFLGESFLTADTGATGTAGRSPSVAETLAGLEPGMPRSLSLHNTHTREVLQAVYWRDGAYQPDTLLGVNHILRDHRTGEMKSIDLNLLDLLHSVHVRLGSGEPFHIISGYRSPATNAELRRQGHGVAAGSLHVEGRAVDVRLPGTRLCDLRAAALALGRGGVGFYPASDFVHLDTGRVRDW